MRIVLWVALQAASARKIRKMQTLTVSVMYVTTVLQTATHNSLMQMET
jgi:hypothetical protein